MTIEDPGCLDKFLPDKILPTFFFTGQSGRAGYFAENAETYSFIQIIIKTVCAYAIFLTSRM